MPRKQPKTTRLYSGTSASALLMDTATRLHGSLMTLMQRGGDVQDDDTCQAVEAVAQTTLRLEAQVGAKDYRERLYTDLKPLSMVGFWYECNDGVVHNLSEWSDDGWHRMACQDKRSPRKSVATVEGQNFCDDCRVLCYLPGEVSDGYQTDTGTEGTDRQNAPTRSSGVEPTGIG